MESVFLLLSLPAILKTEKNESQMFLFFFSFFLFCMRTDLSSSFAYSSFPQSQTSSHLIPQNIPLDQPLPASCPKAVTWLLTQGFSPRQRKIPLMINRCLLRAPKPFPEQWP